MKKNVRQCMLFAIAMYVVNSLMNMNMYEHVC